MSKFLYTVYLPGIDRTVHLTELYFTEYKQLVKVITNDNNNLIAEAFEDIIKNHCIEDVSNCTFLDKLLILLTIRSICISPVLELAITCPVTEQPFDCSIDVSSIISSIEGIQQCQDKKTYFNTLHVTYRPPVDLFITKNIEALETVVYALEKDNLPAAVLKDARNFIKDLSSKLDNIELLTIKSPYTSNTPPITLTANVFNNSVIEFLKILYKRDLMSVYRHEYFLSTNLNINHTALMSITPAEASLYTNLFNEEQREKEKNRKSDGISINAN
jgi:hypothetical protein